MPGHVGRPHGARPAERWGPRRTRSRLASRGRRHTQRRDCGGGPELSRLAAFKELRAPGAQWPPPAPPSPRPFPEQRGGEPRGPSPRACAPPRCLTRSARGSVWLRTHGPWKYGPCPRATGGFCSGCSCPALTVAPTQQRPA